MDAWTDRGWKDEYGWMNGWTDGAETDGSMDGQKDGYGTCKYGFF